MMRNVLFGVMLLVAFACGRAYEDEYVTTPPSPPTGTGTGTDPTPDRFAALKPKFDQYCGTCHNGRVHPLKLDSEQAYRNSRAAARIRSNTMPPGGGLPAAVKAEFLSFLGG